jgi:hypothetical protein
MPTTHKVKVNHRTFDEIGLDKFTTHMGNLNERTRAVYLRNIRLIKQLMADCKWNFNSYGEFFYFFRNEGFFGMVLDAIHTNVKNKNTIKGRFNALIKVNQFLQQTYKHQMEQAYYQKNLQTLSVKLADITEAINTELATHKKNEKEQINMCELEKLQEKVNGIKAFTDDFPSSISLCPPYQMWRDKLLIHLYTFLPARRGEYNGMIVLYEDDDKPSKMSKSRKEHWSQLNYYNIHENVFYINNQKNKKQSIIKGTKEIKDCIKLIVRKFQEDNGDTTQYCVLFKESQSNYSKVVKRTFKRYTGLALTPNLLRKMWVIFSQKQTPEKQIELANMMGHSLQVAKKHYNKSVENVKVKKKTVSFYEGADVLLEGMKGAPTATTNVKVGQESCKQCIDRCKNIHPDLSNVKWGKSEGGMSNL